MCDFKLRRLGSIQRYSVQCVLPVNLFNEKIFLFLWFWIIFIALVTLISMLVWTVRSVVAIDRTRYIKKHLQRFGKISVR